MAPTTQFAPSETSTRPRVLVVDDEPELIEVVQKVIERRFDCDVISAADLREARLAIEEQAVDLLVTDMRLPDGDGLSLLSALHEARPTASAIVITGLPSLDNAINAMRQGAYDFIPKPFTNQQLMDRIAAALRRSDDERRRVARLAKLKMAVRKLNEARKMVSRKVDLLCNDLVSAYTELSRQLDVVRIQEGFRQFIAGAPDLEQLLCHSMDWLLRQLGYSNIGVFLATDGGEFQLGAYMKYTIAGELDLVDSLQKNLVRVAMRKGFVRLVGDELGKTLVPKELEYLAGQDIAAVNCTYLGETLAVIVMFRDGRTPFHDEDIAALKMVSPLFAVSLAKTVRATGGDDEGGGLADGDLPPGKKDPSEWWKRGEQPPF